MQALFYFLLGVLTLLYRYHCTMYRSGLEHQCNRRCTERLTVEVLPYQALDQSRLAVDEEVTLSFGKI